MKKDFSMRGKSSMNPETVFRKPDAAYAPHMFWFWNGCFKSANLREQVRSFCGQGVNPGFMHARFWPSLPHDFWMCPKWLSLFGDALEETSKSGMSLTYTTGNPGFPDQYILSKHPELQARSLEWEILDCTEDAPLPECLFAVAAKRNSARRIASLARIENNVMPGGTSVFLFRIYTDVPTQYRNSFLDKRLFRAWCEVEHNLYEKRYARYFGKTMRGVFVDQEGDWGYKMVWSEDLAETFQSRAGYDISLALPLLIEEDADGRFMKARCDWFDALSECYAECFARPMSEWCRKRSMFMTCHYWEGDLYQQTMQAGDFLRLQRASSVPASDSLFRSVMTNPELFTETASVAEFESRAYLSELLGSAGWDLTPAALKDALGAAVAWGVTNPVLHGASSSPDISSVSSPPDFQRWNPAWPLMHLLSDFSRRACALNDLGRLDAHILLYCPIESVWAMTGGAVFDKNVPHKGDYLAEHAMSLENAHAAAILKLNEIYQKSQRFMRFAHIDFMNADSHYLDGMTAENGQLLYRKFMFHTVILPPLQIIRRSTARKLLEFALDGGRVFSLGALPNASVEFGANDPELRLILRQLADCSGFRPSIPEELVARLVPSVRFRDESEDILTTRRVIGEKTFLWTANVSGKIRHLEFSLPGLTGTAEKYDCESGTISPIRRVSTNSFHLDLDPHEACWIAVQPNAVEDDGDRLPVQKETIRTDFSENWMLFLDPEKQLDGCQDRIQLPDGIMTGLKLDYLASWSVLGFPDFSGTLDYRKSFNLNSVSGTETLVLENVRHTARVFVNGQAAGERMWPPFRFPIGEYLRTGPNEILIEVSNLMLNRIAHIPHYDWKYFQPPTPESMSSGILGSISLST